MDTDAELVVRPSPVPFWAITVAYVLAASVAVLRNWQQMVSMAPNEWGDLAAGVFSPLAFLWFLYTALAQRAELRLQQQELRSNTESQREQEAQMARQADALDAQIQRLRAQAIADFQPIFVLRSSGQAAEGVIVLQVINEGPPVLDVELVGGRLGNIMDMSGATTGSAKGDVVPHWPSGFSVYVHVDPTAAARDGGPFDREFELSVTRLDAVRYRFQYRYLNDAQRIVLQGAGEVLRQ